MSSVLLYDGECGVCNSGVQLILRRERRHTLRFAGLRSDFARALVERHPELREVDSLVWLETGQAEAADHLWLRSDAVLKAAGYLGGAWRIVRVLGLVPRPLRDAAYDLVARNRHRFAGAGPACAVPDARTRARFLP